MQLKYRSLKFQQFILILETELHTCCLSNLLSFAQAQVVGYHY